MSLRRRQFLTLSAAGLGSSLALAACGSTPPAVSSATPAAPAAAPSIKVGIALGGGAAKGFAHIGVIQVL